MILSDSNGGPWDYPTPSPVTSGSALVLIALRELGSGTLRDVAKRAGLSVWTVRLYLWRLRDEGRVRSTMAPGNTLLWEAM